MKKMQCEVCGSNDLIKQDGLFVCQSCGAKYSLDDAKKMVIEGTVEITGTVKVDNSNDLDNYVQIATRSFKALNYDEAIEFCNKGLMINPNDCRLLLIKGMILNAKGKGYEANSLLEEVMKNCSSDDDKEAVAENISERYIDLSSEYLFTEYILFCIKKHKSLGTNFRIIKRLQANTELATVYWDAPYNKERMENGIKYFLKNETITQKESEKNVDKDIINTLRVFNIIDFSKNIKQIEYQVNSDCEFLDKYKNEGFSQLLKENPELEPLDLTTKTSNIIGFPFFITEDQVQHSFIDFLIKEKCISPDVVVNAEIKEIKRQYNVFYYCGGPYTAHWTATCVRTHREEYITTENKIVFVDKCGREFSYQVDGTTPVSKTVPKKDYKTVVDGVNLIDRNESKDYSCFVSGENNDTPLLQWINKEFISIKSKISVLDKSIVDEENTISKNSGKAKEIATERCKNETLAFIKSSIQSTGGCQYKDFTFNFKSNFNIGAEVYLPIYKVIYFYGNDQYEVWFSGFKNGNYFSEKRPENNNNNISKHFFIPAWISFGLCSLLLIFAALAGNSLPLSTMFNILFVIIGLFAVFAVCGITGRIINKRNVKISKQWNSIKEQLLDIQKTEDLDFTAKKQKMDQLLQQYSIKSNYKKPNKKINSNQNTSEKKTISKHYIAIFITSIIIVSSVILGIIDWGNNTKYNNSIVGKWQWDENPSSTLTFTTDGRIISSYDNLANTYVVSGNEITIYSNDDNTIIDTSTYNIKKNKLTFGKDNYTRVEYSETPVNINKDISKNIGCTYGEISKKYGSVIEEESYNGGTYFVFKSNPGMYFFRDENGESLFGDENGQISNPSDKAVCFLIRIKANNFFNDLIDYKLVSDVEQDLGVSVKYYENEIDGGYVCTFDYKNYSVSIDIGEDKKSISENSMVDIYME